jgi:hypothetical protein
MATSIVPILAYVAVSSPATYKATSKLLGSWVASADGLPKMGGLFLHAIVFLFVLALLRTLIGRSSGAAVPGTNTLAQCQATGFTGVNNGICVA